MSANLRDRFSDIMEEGASSAGVSGTGATDAGAPAARDAPIATCQARRWRGVCRRRVLVGVAIVAIAIFVCCQQRSSVCGRIRSRMRRVAKRGDRRGERVDAVELHDAKLRDDEHEHEHEYDGRADPLFQPF